MNKIQVFRWLVFTTEEAIKKAKLLSISKKVHNANGVNKNNDCIVNVITNNVIFAKEIQNYQMTFL